jgi:hypothetical protein
MCPYKIKKKDKLTTDRKKSTKNAEEVKNSAL